MRQKIRPHDAALPPPLNPGPFLTLGCHCGNFGPSPSTIWHYGQWPGHPRPIVAPPLHHAFGRIERGLDQRRNFAKSERPSMNSRTAISLAALSMVGAPPPAQARGAQAPGPGNGRIGRLESQRASRAKSSRGAGVPCAPASQGMGDRDAHVGRAELRHHRAVAVVDQAVDDGLRVHHHAERVRSAARTGGAPRSLPGPCSSSSRSRS